MKQALTIRLTPEARRALELLAQQDSRSMSGLIEKIIKDEAINKGCWSHTAPRAVAR